MNAYLFHLIYEFKATLRDKTMLLMTYLFPLFFFVLMGLLMTKANPGFTQTMAPAMILVAVMSGMLLGMPSTLLGARETGILRSYRINGVPSLAITSIPVLTATLHMTLISIIITSAGYFFFDAALPQNWLAFILVWLAALLAFGGLGALIGVASPNSRASVLISQLVFVPSMVLGGLMMPAAMLPESLVKVASLLPTTHAMNAFSALAYNQPGLLNGWTEMVLLLVSGCMAFGLANFLFHWDPSLKRQYPSWLGVLCLIPFVISMFM